MVSEGDRYRLLQKIGNDVNRDGTPGAPLLPGQVGTVKRSDAQTVILDFPVNGDGEAWMSQPRRSVSFPVNDLVDLFERVED
jgi:hypothetical protein